jgi:DNA-binding MarR family transcriptional regulator
VQAIQTTETAAEDTQATAQTATETALAAAQTDTAAAQTATATRDTALAGDLYALIVFLHKNCNADLFEAVGALELSLSQIKLLHHLDDQPRELSLKEAAEVVHVSMPAASRMVDDLVRRGFAQRREDDDDRRMKRVCLTEGGRTAIRRLNAARLTGLEQFSTHLTTTERLSLAQALEQLLEREDIAACRPEPLP